MNTRLYELTEEEYELFLSTIEFHKDWLEGCNSPSSDQFEAEDPNGELHTALSALENELLWQRSHGKRRPVQR